LLNIIAQKLGLAPKPEPLLTKDQWKQVESIARERKQHLEPCPICMEEFSLNEKQVILNCTHVFHWDCLRSFEKFAQIKCCPLCRKEDYQKRTTTEGKTMLRERAALRIQKTWRGYVVWKLYRKAILDLNPDKKKGYYAKKLADLAERYSQWERYDTKKLDGFLESLDDTVKISRLMYITDDDWITIRQKARERGDIECSICMCDIAADQDNRECIVTSCSHCFHDRCIQSFERFSLIGTHPMCPVCRSYYIKAPLFV
jgi:hypothetical protein